jgi:hypothetical protein
LGNKRYWHFPVPFMEITFLTICVMFTLEE